jgi:hypothetical protein
MQVFAALGGFATFGRLPSWQFWASSIYVCIQRQRNLIRDSRVGCYGLTVVAFGSRVPARGSRSKPIKAFGFIPANSPQISYLSVHELILSTQPSYVAAPFSLPLLESKIHREAPNRTIVTEARHRCRRCGSLELPRCPFKNDDLSLRNSCRWHSYFADRT